MNLESKRADFPVLLREFDHKPLVYFDNAATSLKPNSVIEAMSHYYTQMSANVHRGLHKLSEQASQAYEESHETVGNFIHAKPDEISYTMNTTSAINSVMYSLLESGKLDGKEILVSRAEHHANLVPWQFAAKKANAKLKFIELEKDYSVSLENLEQTISNNTALVAVAHITNTVAAINDVQQITKIAHDHDSLVLIDGAQSAPHLAVDVKKIDCDFYAFSAHKMLGPTGIGALYGKKKILEELPPFLYGGSMIHSVSYEKSTWNKLPDKFEAGTPHVAGALGFSAAVKYLQKIGMDNIRKHDHDLTAYALKRMSENKLIQVHGPKDAKKQGGIILFDHPKLGCHELSLALDEAANIAIRSGMHCAEPMVSQFNPNGLCRASFYLYNTEKEIDVFCETMETITNAFS